MVSPQMGTWAGTDDEEPSLADWIPEGSTVVELEGQLERQLDLSRWEERRDGAIPAVGTVGVRIGVVHRIESIECLAAKIQVGGLAPKRKCLVQAGIGRIEAIVAEGVSAGVSVGLGHVGWNGDRGGTEIPGQ